MRIIKFLVQRNIGIATYKRLCEFLMLDDMNVNSKLTVERQELIDKTLNSGVFEKWLQIKLSLFCIEINESKNILKPLFYNSIDPIDDLLGERMINSLIFLINNGFYSSRKENLFKIVNSNKCVMDKIFLLKQSEPFSKKRVPSQRTSTSGLSIMSGDTDLDNYEVDNMRDYSSSSYDPYEDISWGGLNGEEAFIGYWNTD